MQRAMKKAVPLALILLLLLALFTMHAAAVGNYGVNLESAAYLDENPFYRAGLYGQCTWYCYGRAYEHGVVLNWGNGSFGNAIDWYSNASAAGYRCDSVPSANSIMVSPDGWWTDDTTGITYQVGHVMYVEAVDGDYAYITEGNFSGAYHEDVIQLSTGRRNWGYGNGFSITGYIHLPVSVPPVPTVSVSNTRFQVGDQVQVFFGDWNNAAFFEYYMAEYPEAFAYSTYTKHDVVYTNSVTFDNLPAGRYNLLAHAGNGAGLSGRSNWVSFDVYEQDYIPSGHTIYNGHIYAVYDYSASWTFCRDLCSNMGGHLVTINSAEENAIVAELMQEGAMEAYWIGATNYSGTAINQDGAWAWVTGEEFQYTNWKPGEPSATGTEGTREHWAEIRKSYSGQWNDVNNTNKTNKGFIIEIEPNEADITTRESFNGSEYLLIDRNTTWSEAVRYCSLLGGQLLAINSSEEEAFINSFIKSGTRSWYYVGGRRENGSWYWLNGTETGDEIPSINWNGNLWPSHCNYLMKYRDSCKYINLPNVYYPEDDISHIGFICEIKQTALSITRQPQNYTGPLGSRATFTVGAEGDGLSYQWYVKNRTATKFSKSSITAATYSEIGRAHV